MALTDFYLLRNLENNFLKKWVCIYPKCRQGVPELNKPRQAGSAFWTRVGIFGGGPHHFFSSIIII
jgi:hypothetical protein